MIEGERIGHIEFRPVEYSPKGEPSAYDVRTYRLNFEEYNIGRKIGEIVKRYNKKGRVEWVFKPCGGGANPYDTMAIMTEFIYKLNCADRKESERDGGDD